MAPSEDERVAEGSLLLRQALRLLDDDVPCTADRRVLIDLAADLAAEAAATLQGRGVDAPVPSVGQQPAP